MNRQAAGGIRQQRERNVPRRLRCSTLLAAAPPKASLSVRCTLNALAGASVHGRAYEARNSPTTCLARDASMAATAAVAMGASAAAFGGAAIAALTAAARGLSA